MAQLVAVEEVFGDPAKIVFFINAMLDKMIEDGHDVEVIIKERKEVLQMLERVIHVDVMLKNEANGKLMTKNKKVTFVIWWKKKIKKTLEDKCLIPNKGNELLHQLKFFSGIFFSISDARKIAPFLHSRVF